MTLHGELTKPPVAIEWRRGDEVLQSSHKYDMRQDGAMVELLIRNLELEDTGEYTCMCGEEHSRAVLLVHGNNFTILNF